MAIGLIGWFISAEPSVILLDHFKWPNINYKNKKITSKSRKPLNRICRVYKGFIFSALVTENQAVTQTTLEEAAISDSDSSEG